MTDKQVREKLLARGPEALSDAELLAVLLQEGTLANDSTTELTEKILAHPENTLTALSRMDIRQLRMVEGIGIKRAALELGRRLALETVSVPASIRSNDDVLKIFQPQLSPLPHEEFWVLYL